MISIEAFLYQSTSHVDYSVRVCRACTSILCVCVRGVYRGVSRVCVCARACVLMREVVIAGEVFWRGSAWMDELNNKTKQAF